MSIDDELNLSDMRQRAVKSSYILLIRQIVIRALGFIGLLVLARLLTPEIFGVFAILNFMILFFEQAGSFGLPAALVRQRAPVSVTQLRVVFTVQSIVLVISSMLIIFLSPLLVEHFSFNAEVQNAIYWMIIALLFSSLKLIPKIQLQRQMRHEQIALIEIVEYLVYLLVAIGLSYIGLGLWALVVATVLRSGVGAGMCYYFSSWAPMFAIDSKVLKPLIGFAIPIQVASWAELANRSLIPVIVGSLAGVQVVGSLNFANTLLATLVVQPINLIGKVLFRVFGRIQDDKVSLSRNLERSYLMLSAVILLPLSMLASMADQIVLMLVGDKWLQTAQYIPLMCVGFAFYSILQPSTRCLHALGDAWTPTKVTITRLVVMCGCTYFLYPYSGALSFPIGVAIAFPISALFVNLAVWRRIGVHGGLFILGPLIAAAVAAFCMHQFVSHYTGSFIVLIGCVIGVIVYIIILGVLVGNRISKLIKVIVSIEKALPKLVIHILEKLSVLFDRLSINIRSAHDK